jgi:hypothetical protein
MAEDQSCGQTRSPEPAVFDLYEQGIRKTQEFAKHLLADV